MYPLLPTLVPLQFLTLDQRRAHDVLVCSEKLLGWARLWKCCKGELCSDGSVGALLMRRWLWNKPS